MNSYSSNAIAAGSSPDLWLSGSEVRQHRASGWAEQAGNPSCHAGHPCLVDVSDTLWTRLMTFPLTRFLYIFCFLRYMARTAISFTGVNGHNTRWPWGQWSQQPRSFLNRRKNGNRQKDRGQEIFNIANYHRTGGKNEIRSIPRWPCGGKTGASACLQPQLTTSSERRITTRSEISTSFGLGTFYRTVG